jgi:hypothetical protein
MPPAADDRPLSDEVALTSLDANLLANCDFASGIFIFSAAPLPRTSASSHSARRCRSAMKKPSVPCEAGVNCSVSSRPSAERGGS